MILKIRLWASQHVRQPINPISPAVLEVEETSKMGKRVNEVRPISQILTLLFVWLASKAKGIKKEGESRIFLKLGKLKFYCDRKKKLFCALSILQDNTFHMPTTDHQHNLLLQCFAKCVCPSSSSSSCNYFFHMQSKHISLCLYGSRLLLNLTMKFQ